MLMNMTIKEKQLALLLIFLGFLNIFYQVSIYMFVLRVCDFVQISVNKHKKVS